MLAALLNVTGWMVLMGLALLWLPASETALIAYTMPVWASLLAWPVLGERPTLLRTVSLVMAFAGLAAIMGGNGVDGPRRQAAGDIDGAGGSIGFALGTVLAKKLPLRLPPIPAAAWQIGHRLFSGRDRRPRDRDHASGEGQPARLVAAVLFHRDPVLHRLCQLVCRAGAAAGLGRGDRHHGGAGDRRGGLGDRAAASRSARSRSWRCCSRWQAWCWRRGRNGLRPRSLVSHFSRLHGKRLAGKSAA